MALACISVHMVEQLPKIAATSVYVPRVSCSCLLPLQETPKLVGRSVN